MEVQGQKGSSDIMKIMITETTDERPGADVDDGFTTTESKLAVYSGEAAERETLARRRWMPDMASSWRVRVAPPGLWCVRVPGQLQSPLSITGSGSTC